MTLTAIVGALVALVARPKELQRTRDQEEIERLNRSQRKLIDRIETLELENQGLTRELAAERNLSTHWIGEAARFAREARVLRQAQDVLRQAQDEEREAWRAYQPQQDPRQALAQALQQAAALRQQQCNQALAQQNLRQNLLQNPLALQAQQNLQAQNLQQQAFQGGFCNCVPSRTQMFDAMVEQLNQSGR